MNIITIRSKRRSIFDIFKKQHAERRFSMYTITPVTEERKENKYCYNKM